jgi:endonuclease YncB( thermonuclease family)
MRWMFLLLSPGCYQVPEDLPDFVEVPEVAGRACAPSRTAQVACVLDGDTFDLFQCGDNGLGERVRLLGVNAPEIAHDGTPAECFGDQAGVELRNLIEGRTLSLEFDVSCTDVFGRTLAWAFVEEEGVEPLLVNTWLVERGFARLYEEFEFDELRYVGLLRAADASAQATRSGLWGQCQEP